MKIHVMFTIDVESTHLPIDDFNLFEGALKIAEILKNNGIRGVFFCDYFEMYKHGDRVNEVIEKLSHDHDVELHTHPGHKIGKYCYMTDFNYDEQFEFIKEGISIFNEMGINPVAHRAGAYAINNDTMKALEANSILIDSSIFPFNTISKVSSVPNKITKIGNVLEIPINIFQRKKLFKCLPRDLQISAGIKKIDLDWCSLNEILWYIETASQHNINFINIFMHSYSLMKLNKKYKNIGEKNIDKLNSLLKYLVMNKEVEFVSINTVDKVEQNTLDSDIPIYKKVNRSNVQSVIMA